MLVALLSCVSEPTAPGKAAIRYASGLRFTALFPTILQQAGVADLVTFDRVRVVLHHSDGTIALDTTIVFPPDRNEISLDLSVRLLAGTPATGELMTLDLGYLNAANEIVFRGGPVQIRATPSLPGQAPPPPVSIPVVYAGAGATARAVRISPRTLTVNAGDAFGYAAVAVDASGTTVQNTPIFWTSLDPTRATITSPGQGAGRALAVRGTARIVAGLITGQADTVTLTVQPVPATIAAVSGGGQTGIVGKPAPPTLAQPLVVRVTATDGLPVAGASVSFAVGSGGGAVTPASTTTDVNGLAQASWTLGNVPGAQTVTATSGSLAGSPVSFGATAQATVATRLAITSAPAAGANIAAGATIGVVVAARDVDGDPVATFTGNVTLAFAASPSGATLGGATTVAAAGGVATFSNLTIGTPGTGYVLAASAASLIGAASPAFNIVTGPPSNMVLVSGGAQTAATNSALAPITVALTDASGNAKVNIPIAFAVTSGGGSVTPATVTTDASGRASATWTLGPSAGAQTLGVSTTGVTTLSVAATATSTTNHWVITQQPLPSQVAGGALAPPIIAQLKDNANNTVSSFNGTASVAIGANPGGSTIAGTTSSAAVSGVATFANVSLNKAGAGYTLVVSSPNDVSATTSAFTVAAAGAATLALQSGNNQSGAFGAQLGQPIVARVLDSFGNGVPATTVTFTAAGNSGSVTPASASTDANGLASTQWTLGASGPQTMAVASTGLAGSPITVSAGIGAGSLATTAVTPRADTITSFTEAHQLTATGRDAANTIVGGTWSWASRNPAVATVNGSGQVTSVANGVTYVVATEAGGTKDSAQVVVQQRIASVNVSPSTRSIYTGGTVPFTAQAVDGRSVAMVVQPTFAWSSSQPSVASANAATGVVSGLAIGSSQIRATSGATVGTANLTVLTPITRIDVSFDSTGAPAPDNFTMVSLGDRRLYRALARDTLLNPMTGIVFTWYSTNASVAVIDSTTATQARATAAANGLTSIQASAQGVTGSGTLTVAQVLSSIELTPTTTTVAVTGTTSMLARGKDANGRYISGGSFTYASSLPSVATIGATTGVVTGVNNGTTSITAASGAITSNTATVAVSSSGPAIISFGRDTIGVGRGTALSVPVLLSKPNAAPVTVTLAVADTFAFWSTASVTIGAGQTAVNATLNGRNAGTTRITALDGSGTGYAGDTAVVAVQANLRMAGSYSFNATDQVATQVLLSDPSPAGGTFVTFAYGTSGRASLSPDPAFIPAGQLAADVVIRGLTAGSTTLTPTASGVNGTATSVSIAAANLTAAPSTVRLGQGQYEQYAYVQVPNGVNTPLVVTLTSTDTSIVTVPPSLTIGTNQNYSYYTVTARGRGTAKVIATAAGWRPDTTAVVSTTPMVRICCTSAINSTAPAQGVTVYSADSLRSANYRSSSLAVRISSSDMTVMRVIDTLVTIAAGSQANSNGRVIPAGAGGTAWIKSSAGGHTADSVLYTVTGPALTLSYITNRLGLGQQETGHYIQIPNSVGTPVVVTITSSDSTIVAADGTVTIPASSYYASITLRGKSTGTARLVFTATGYSPDTGTTTVTTPWLTLTGGTTINAFSVTSTRAYVRDSVGSVHDRITPLAVSFRSTDTTVLTVDSLLTIPAGSYQTPGASVVAVGTGPARIIATAPGHRPDTNTWTVRQPKLLLSWTTFRLGARQYESPNSFYVQLPNARAVPVTVTLTQKRASSVALSATSVTIPGNGISYEYFTLAALTPGRDTIIASATGYLPDTGFVTVTTPKLYVSGLPSSATTTSPPSTVTVYAADSLNGVHLASDTIVVRAVSTDSTVLRPTQPYFRILKNSYYAQPTVMYVGVGSARIIYSDSASGYRPDSTNLVTVTGPSLTVCCGSPGRLGMRQQSQYGQFYVQTANTVGSPLVVSLLSTDPRVATVPATVTIPSGSNYVYFTIAAQDTLGTIQVQATATGYSGGSVNMQVTAPKFVLSTSTTRNTTSPPSTITVYAADANGTQHDVTQNVVVTLASSAPGVASIDSTSVTILAGNSANNNAKWRPVSVGTAQLSASDARAAFYAYGSGTSNVTVAVPQAYLSFSTLSMGIGQFEDQYVQLPDNTSAPVVVPITHAAVPRTSTPATVTIPSGTTYEFFRLTGTSAGSDTITVSPPGHVSNRGVVIVGLGRIDPVSGWPATLRAGDSVQVTAYTREPNQGVRSVLAATTFTLGTNANLRFVSGGSSSAAITSVVVPAGGNSATFWVKGVTAGTGSATITNSNYTAYTNTIAVTP